MDLEIGQKVLVVHQEPNRQNAPEYRGWYTITKIGRMYAYAEGDNGYPSYRISLKTFRIDGLHGRCFLSEQGEIEYKNAVTLWKKFQRIVGGMYNLPDGVTERDIAKAAKFIGVEVDATTNT